MWRIRSACDPAAGLSNRADYFVLATVGLNSDTGLIHVLDILRARVLLHEQATLLEQHYTKWKLRGLPYILIEKVMSQTALIQTLVRRGQCPVKALDLPTWSRLHGGQQASKEVRAASLAARYEQRQIIHPPNALWLDEYEAELLAFPRGEHDDMVDAVTYAVDDLVLSPGFRPTTAQYHGFSYDSDMRPLDDTSGLYADLGVSI